MPANEHHEFHLGKNTVIILVVIQLTAALFGIMMISGNQTFNALSCTTPGAGTSNQSTGNAAICQLNTQVSGISSTVHSLTNVMACANNPTLATCSLNFVPGDFFPEWSYQLANMLFGVFSFFGYLIFLAVQGFLLVLFITTVFFPQLFSAGAVGVGLGALGAGLGVLFGIMFDGATLIMIFYALQLIKDVMPWFGKH